MHKVCHYINLHGLQSSQYADYMHKMCKNMLYIKYALNMQIHAKFCIKYAITKTYYCKYAKKICKKYAKEYAKEYAKNMQNMQNMHKSMYWHILHIYELTAPRWSTRCSMPPRTGRPAAGSCCARRTSRPVALAGRP